MPALSKISPQSSEADHDAHLSSMAAKLLSEEDLQALDTVKLQAPVQCERRQVVRRNLPKNGSSTIFLGCWHLILLLSGLQTLFCLSVLIPWPMISITRSESLCNRTLQPEPPRLSFCPEVNFTTELQNLTGSMHSTDGVLHYILNPAVACIKQQLFAPAGVVRQLSTLEHIWLHHIPVDRPARHKAQTASNLVWPRPLRHVLQWDYPDPRSVLNSSQTQIVTAAGSLQNFALCLDKAIDTGATQVTQFISAQGEEVRRLKNLGMWVKLKQSIGRNVPNANEQRQMVDRAAALQESLDKNVTRLQQLAGVARICADRLDRVQRACQHFSQTSTGNEVLEIFASAWRSQFEQSSTQLDDYYFVDMPAYRARCEVEPWLVHVAKHWRHHGGAEWMGFMRGT